MIGVGIHEGVVLSSNTGLVDNGFNIIFARKQETNIYAAMTGTGGSLQADEVKLLQFTVNSQGRDNTVKNPYEVGNDILNFHKTLCEILSCHFQADQVAASMDMTKIFAAVGITKANENQLAQRFADDNFTAGLFKSVATAFLNVAKPMMDNTQLRVKLCRRSKDSHFPTIPFKGAFEEVWIEPMTVTAQMSKISFSQWEIDNGRNSGEPVKADKPANTAAAVAAFGAVPTTPVAATPVQPATVPGVEVQPTAQVAPQPIAQPAVQQATTPVAQPIAANPVAHPAAVEAAPVVPAAGIPVPPIPQA